MGKGKGSAKAVASVPVVREANDALVAKQMHQLQLPLNEQKEGWMVGIRFLFYRHLLAMNIMY